MRFVCLGSGSRGNATVVESGAVRVLVDCGFTLRELERRLAERQLDAAMLDAVLVTHEHGDHVRGVPALSRKYGLPLWMTQGTANAARCSGLQGLRVFTCHAGAFCIGALRVEPYAVPHDAREPSQFIFHGEGVRLAMLTDAGSVTAHILEKLDNSDALILECNHDPAMLTQRRVGGGYGHLSNAQAGALLSQLDHAKLRHLVAAHLSEKNNHPEKVRQRIASVSARLQDRFTIAQQDHPTAWLSL